MIKLKSTTKILIAGVIAAAGVAWSFLTGDSPATFGDVVAVIAEIGGILGLGWFATGKDEVKPNAQA